MKARLLTSGRSAAKLLTKDEAQWIAVNIAKLPTFFANFIGSTNCDAGHSTRAANRNRLRRASWRGTW
jgi:hypothetical protein